MTAGFQLSEHFADVYMYLYVCEHQGDLKINILLYYEKLSVARMPKAFGGCPLSPLPWPL